MRFLILLAIVFILPACKGLSSSDSDDDSPAGGLSNPEEVSIDLANADNIPYNLSIWEYANGAPLSEVRIAWPIVAKTGADLPVVIRKTTIHADSAVYTHSVNLYLTSGALSDTYTLTKGAGQVYLAITIQAGKMTVQKTQF